MKAWILCLAPVALGGIVAPASLAQEPALPGVADGPQIDFQKGYHVTALDAQTWVVTDGIYQAMFAATGEGVVVFDAPPSIGQNLMRAIAETTREPVTHLVYSHSHIDHIGAASLFGDDVTIVASAETARKLARFDDEERPDPDIQFGEKYTLRVGSLVANLAADGDGHEPGNLFIHLPDRNVLMAVDIIFPGWVPFTNLGMAEDIGLYTAHHDELLAYDFDHFVGGHLGRVGTRADLVTQKEYMADLVAAAKSGRAEADFMAVAQRVGFTDKWRLVGTYMDEVAAICAQRMLAEWEDRLGGAQTSTPGHCWMMQEFLGINGEPDAHESVVDGNPAATLVVAEGTVGLTVINRLQPEAADRDEMLAALRDGIRDEMRSREGFVRAAIHASEDSNDVIVYAQWTSRQALMEAAQAVQAGQAPRLARAYALGNPEYHPFEVVEIIEGR